MKLKKKTLKCWKELEKGLERTFKSLKELGNNFSERINVFFGLIHPEKKDFKFLLLGQVRFCDLDFYGPNVLKEGENNCFSKFSML